MIKNIFYIKVVFFYTEKIDSKRETANLQNILE